MKVVFLVSCATLLLLPSGSALRCYTCLFPTISPLDCLKFPTPCGPSQRCLTSVIRGHRGALELVIYEKTCGDPSMCGAHGTRPILGTNFTFYSSCCDTDLCNSAARGLSLFWGQAALIPLSVILVNLQ
ncbi:protein Bouncer-like [Zootoca vivipara]|uniref:protein Bouncer-like n=1 Tax=Zootoca vivipara TaxID=8524 RepID=UPI00293BB000|nr:protein Bouncer-like [Zootoca vivipara]